MSQPTFPHGIFLTNEKWAFLGLSIYQNSVGSHDFLTRLTRSVSAKEGRLAGLLELTYKGGGQGPK